MRSLAETVCRENVKVRLTGVMYAVCSALLFATLNVVIRYSASGMTVWHMMFGRSFVAALAMLALARWLGVELLGRRRRDLVLAGISGAGGITCLTAALTLLPLFQALVLLYLYPVFAALMSPALTGDRMSAVDWMLIALAVCGTTLILWSGPVESRIQWGHLLGVAAAFGYGLMLTMIRRASSVNHPLTPLFYVSATGCLICIAPLLCQENPFPHSGWAPAALFAIGAIASLAHLASNKALSFLPSPKVGVIGMLEVVLGGLSGYLLFSEALGWRSLIGALLVIGCGILLTLRPQTPPAPGN